MEQYYSNDSLTAFHTENGILIEEKNKGSLKMLVFLSGLSLLVLIGGFVIGLVGGSIGRAMGPFLIWGGAIVFAISIIAFIIRLVVKTDNKIILNTIDNTLTLRGKVSPFSDIEHITHQEQSMMGKTMMFGFIMIGGKKKSLFTGAVVAKNPKDMVDLITNLNDVVQKGKSPSE